MSNNTALLEMTTLFERLRLQLRFRELKTRFGDDQALSIVEEALRLEFREDLGTEASPQPSDNHKNSPVVFQ